MLSISDPNPTPVRKTKSQWSPSAGRRKALLSASIAAPVDPGVAPQQRSVEPATFMSATSSKPFRVVPRMGAEAPKAEETRNTTQQAETSAQAPSDLVRFSEALKNTRNDVQNDNAKDAAPKAFAAAAGADPVNVLEFKATSRNEFEVVLGRRQIASCLFAGTVLVAIFAAGSYFAGKMSTPSCAAAASLPTNVPIPIASSQDSSIIEKTTNAQETAASVKQNGFPFVATAAASSVGMPDTSSATDSPAGLAEFPVTGTLPLFVNPQQGALYLQMGALDKNMSAIVAEGLRERGYKSFVAPGASEKLYRVLVGPFANPDEYKRVKTETESIDVNAVAREVLSKRAVASK